MLVGQDVALYGQTDEVSSLLALYVPLSQGAQEPVGEMAVENGSKLGCAMNVPGRQHPKRPVDVKSLPGDGVEDKACHWPPHKVRLKPLLENTLKRRKEQGMGSNIYS